MTTATQESTIPVVETIKEQLDNAEYLESKTKEKVSEYVNEGKQERCNCNDPYKTHPCPIHFQNKKKEAIQKEAVIIGDDKLLDIRSWVGHVFSCPACGHPSIMHFGNYCMNCGLHVLIQSKKVTESIEKMMRGDDI